jgi:hypothetical protein
MPGCPDGRIAASSLLSGRLPACRLRLAPAGWGLGGLGPGSLGALAGPGYLSVAGRWDCGTSSPAAIFAARSPELASSMGNWRCDASWRNTKPSDGLVWSLETETKCYSASHVVWMWALHMRPQV